MLVLHRAGITYIHITIRCFSKPKKICSIIIIVITIIIRFFSYSHLIQNNNCQRKQYQYLEFNGPCSLIYFSTCIHYYFFQKSIQKSATKQLCCLCCSSGPITTFLSIDRHGFVPGEPITINAEIENLSGRKIRSSSVTLKMV